MRRARDEQAHAARAEPQKRLRQQIDGRVLVEVQRGAVVEQHLEPAARGAQAIAGEQQHVGFGALDLAVVLELDLAVDDRDVRGDVVAEVLLRLRGARSAGAWRRGAS